MKKLKNKAFTKRKTAAVFVTGLVMSTAFTVYAATEHFNDASTTASTEEWNKWKEDWNAISEDYEKVSVNVGANQSELRFAFYTHTSDKPKVRFSRTKQGLSKATVFEGSLSNTSVNYSDALKKMLLDKGETLNGTEKYNAAKVTVKGLKENTKYYYQVYQNGKWGGIKTYTTKDANEYSVLYVGDPQIGACKGQTDSESSTLSGKLAARNDAYNWNDILTETLTQNKDISFIISAGDQVNKAENEYEYSGFLHPEILSSVALSTTIGNHDSSDISYTNHFNNPNTFELNDKKQSSYTAGHTAAGSDYYYTYGDVLYIVLDTNNYNCATHENVIKKAVGENSKAKWRVVVFHQDIYGSGANHSDSDGIVLRTQLTPLMDKYDIDVVLQGHDHTYSRSFQISSDGKAHKSYDYSNFNNENATEYAAQNRCYNLCSNSKDGNTLVNPKGTVYFEQNSATGSKFYNLSNTQQEYISERSQTWTPTYSILKVNGNALKITTYDASTGDELNGSSSYTIIKEKETKKDISKSQVKLSQYTYTYTGRSCKPKVTIPGLTENKEYTVKYESNTNAGTGKVIISGKGRYSGTITKSFTIKPARITSKAVTCNTSAVEYRGKAITPKVMIKGLKQNRDYTVKYMSNNSVGTAKIVVTGKGNYTGTVTKEFKIVLGKTSTKLTTQKGKLTVQCSKVTGADGYEIFTSTNKRTYVKAMTIESGTKVTLKETSKKKYYVKVRAYTYKNGVKVYSSFSTVKSIKVK